MLGAAPRLRVDSLVSYWRETGRETENPDLPVVWAVVRVLDGRAVLENVMVDGRPIREVVDVGTAAGDGS